MESRKRFVHAARSLWLIPEIIPPITRDDVALLYCFCRDLDDTVDEAPCPQAAARGLDRIEGELAGRVQARPLIAALLAGAPRMGLPLDAAHLLIGGIRSDLNPGFIGDDDELVRYCYRVSSTVGLMLAAVLGFRHRRSLPYAVDLGIGLQLTNIVHGVAEDARRGRVYLPATRLARAGLRPEDVLQRPPADRLGVVLCGMVDLADQYYGSAERGMGDVPLRYRHGIMLLSRIYGAIGRRTRRYRHDPFAGPMTVPVWERVVALGSVVTRAWRPELLGLRPPPPHDPVLHRAIAGWPGAAPVRTSSLPG